MSFYQYFKENFTQEKPIAASASVPKGTRVIIHAKHDVGPVKLVMTTKEDTTAEQIIHDVKQDDPSIVTAVVYLATDNQVTEMTDDKLAGYISSVSHELTKPKIEPKRRSPDKMRKSIGGMAQARRKLADRDRMRQPVEEEDEQQQVSATPQDAAKQQQVANIDRMIAQRQAQMANLRQNADRAQQQVRAKQKEIDQLMRQKGAVT